jgi:predicted nucleic acid-binding protein
VQKNADRTYLDSSALVKLIARERETDALVGFLAKRPSRVSCALIRVEVLRAMRSHGPEAVQAARDILPFISQMDIDDPLLDLAATINTTVLRSLDAIHLAAAARLAPNIEVVTYDRRMADAARAIGLPVVSPGA